MPCGLDITAFVGDDGTADLGDLDVGFPLGANVYRWRRVSLLGMLYNDLYRSARSARSAVSHSRRDCLNYRRSVFLEEVG